ncbi:integrin beta-1-binding protein 2 isoform X1 [Struthio camelus]|uniref:integrin beta-1-binding protein 2 isoform X1 n=1 Tax=Struthio camelus TaxID=8801 RepID=UPI0036042760
MASLCYNKGCGQRFDAEHNSPDSCVYHPGVPIFHDALKGWSCCKKRTTDFSEFLAIKVSGRAPPLRPPCLAPLRPPRVPEMGARRGWDLLAGDPTGLCRVGAQAQSTGRAGEVCTVPWRAGGGSRGWGSWWRLLLPLGCSSAPERGSLHRRSGCPTLLLLGRPADAAPCPGVGPESVLAGRGATRKPTGLGSNLHDGQSEAGIGLSPLPRAARRGITARRSPLSRSARRRPQTSRRPSRRRSSSSKDQHQLRRCSGKDRARAPLLLVSSSDEPRQLLPIKVSRSLEQALERLSAGAEDEAREGNRAGEAAARVRAGAACANAACKAVYQGPGSNTETCTFHPGVPVFHEGMKYWSCCAVRTTDFGAFLEQPGCSTGRHCWAEKGDKTAVSCRQDWHQTSSHVVVTVYARNPLPALSTVKANRTVLEVHLVFEGNKIFQAELDLWGVIEVEKSFVSMVPTKVEITLSKASPVPWGRLELAQSRSRSGGEQAEKDVADTEEPAGAQGDDSDDSLSWSEEEDEEVEMGTPSH